jgi:hypothetical protein
MGAAKALRWIDGGTLMLFAPGFRPAVAAVFAILLSRGALGATQSDAPPLDAVASDPVTMGWMVGSPPSPDRIIRFADGSFRRFPQSRWAFSNMRQFVPTATISRGEGGPADLPRAELAGLDDVAFQPIGRAERMTWSQSLFAN